MTAEIAITAAYLRGKAAASLQTDGAMLAVGVGADVATNYINQISLCGQVVVGCYNSPNSVTLTGDRGTIEELEQLLQKERVFARMLKTGGMAYHSSHVEGCITWYLQSLEQEAADVASSDPRQQVPMFSTVKENHVINAKSAVPNSYWIDNLTSPVLFQQGVQHMLNELPHINTIVEVGPHSALAGSLRQICQHTSRTDIAYMSTLKRNESEGDNMLRLAGALWAHDSSIDMTAVTSLSKLATDNENIVTTRIGSLLVDLPPYHWTYSKPCLFESRFSKEHREMKEPRHDILGRRVIGSSNLEPLWRNVLRPQDLPWLVQHRVGGEIILPAAAYLALAIEAVTQICAQEDQPLTIASYTLRDVVISSATVVREDDSTGTETLFRLQRSSNKSSKAGHQWYRFSSSCCILGAWKETASGMIGTNIKSRAAQLRHRLLPETRHQEPFIDWLDKYRILGVDLGPVFRHIETIQCDQNNRFARGAMRVSSSCGLMDAESRYVLHPTVLDSCLQPHLLSVCRGRLEEMRCCSLPTHFREATIYNTPSEQLEGECMLQVWTEHLGNRAFLSSSQLIASDSSLLVDITGCRQLLHSAAMPRNIQHGIQQDLYMKLDWKIDTDYLSRASEAGALSSQHPTAALVHLMLHKDPAARILCFDSSLEVSLELEGSAPLSITFAVASKNDKNAEENLTYPAIELDINSLDPSQADGPYQMIITPTMNSVDQQILQNIRAILSNDGRLLLSTTEKAPTEAWLRGLASSGFTVDVIVPQGIIVAKPVLENKKVAVNGEKHPLSQDRVLLLHQNEPTSLLANISQQLSENGWDVCTESISSAGKLGLGVEHVVLLEDAESPLLANLTADQLHHLVSLTDEASKIVWVTCGGLLTGERPEFGMTEGLARVIRRERASVDLVTIDFDIDSTPELRVATLVHDVIARQRDAGVNGEVEYRLENGVVYIGRITSHRDVHERLVPESGESTVVHQRSEPAVKAVLENGNLVYDRDDTGRLEPLGPDDVEIRTAAIGLAAPDSSDDVGFLSHQVAGTVTRVGSSVRGVRPGMDVFGLAFGHMATFQRTSCRLVHPLPLRCSLTTAATISSPYVTAMYGLEELARIQPGENIAIFDDIGDAGLAAVQVCHILGATPIVVTQSAGTKDLLLESCTLSSRQIIFNSDEEFSNVIENATDGAGLDVIVCSATSSVTRVAESAQCLAALGRIVVIGHSKGNSSPTFPAILSNNKEISVFNLSIETMAAYRQPTIQRSVRPEYIPG